MTIAGSDPSGGAGLQADLKTFHQFGVYGLAVPALLTVQNTLGIESVTLLDQRLVRAQLACVQSDIPPDAAKVGALGQAGTVVAVADWARASNTPVVIDPVMLSSSGQALLDREGVEALIDHLLPTCFLATPNLSEAAKLCGRDTSDLEGMRAAAEDIAGMGARNVLVKGGHLRGAPIDLLWTKGKVRTYTAERVRASGTHGTGCTYSAAITALLALGRPLEDAVSEAKRFLTEALRTAPRLGRGQGPLNHHARLPGNSALTLP